MSHAHASNVASRPQASPSLTWVASGYPPESDVEGLADHCLDGRPSIVGGNLLLSDGH